MGRVLRHPVSAGVIGGLVWGIALRAWMRYITTDPEFTWSGTLFIVGATTLVGALLGFARHRRNLGGVGWWRFSVLGLLLLGAGGSVMWPSVILGAIALGITRPAWVRLLLGAGAVAAQVPVLAGTVIGNGRLFERRVGAGHPLVHPDARRGDVGVLGRLLTEGGRGAHSRTGQTTRLRPSARHYRDPRGRRHGACREVTAADGGGRGITRR